MGKKRTSKQRAAQNASKNVTNSTKGGKGAPPKNFLAQGEGLIVQNGVSKHKNDDVADVPIAPVSCPPKGLVNLGNTCFFNSVMQNLCRTPGLLYVLQRSEKEKNLSIGGEDLPVLDCEIPMLSKLSQSLLNFLITMSENSMTNFSKQRARTRTESPRNLFSQICLVSPRFRGYQQQDSQELLQALLDGIKTEEIKRRKQAILTKLGLVRKKANEIDSDLKEKVKGYGRIASTMPTVVDLIFSGKIVSSVLCDECGKITQVVEDFLDIPLPIAEGVPSPHNGGNKKSGKKPPAEEEKQESKEKDSLPPASQSKHAKKKQRQENRKKNHRRRTKSQNAEESDKNAKNELEAADKDSQEEDEKKDSPCDIEEKKVDSCKSLAELDEDSMKKDFEEHIKEQMQDVEENQDGDSINLDHDDDLGKENDGHINGFKAGEENRDDERVSFCISSESGNQLQEKIEQNGDSASDLASQFETLEIMETHTGTDFSTNKAKSRKLDIKIKENGDCQEHPPINIRDEVDLVEKANGIVNSAMSNAFKQYGTEKPMIEPLTCNGHVTECNNNYLPNGKMEFECGKKMECDNALNDGKQQNGVVLSDESNDATRTSPSSGNDEKELSENEISKHGETQNEVSLFDTPAKKPEVRFTGFCAKLPTSISPRYESKKLECSIESCLHKFTMAEMLTGNNKFGCEECTKRQAKGEEEPATVYCNASKQLFIQKPPLILTLQLKRFQQSGRNLRKFSKKVEIPAVFDLAPFCTADEDENQTDKEGQILYRLYGVVEHSGSLSRGHYMAYVNARQESKAILNFLGKEVKVESSEVTDDDAQGQWYYISDTSVSKSTLEKAQSCNAYLLFYERIL